MTKDSNAPETIAAPAPDLAGIAPQVSPPQVSLPQSPETPKPKTPAEAMKPLSEESIVPPKTENASTAETSQLSPSENERGAITTRLDRTIARRPSLFSRAPVRFSNSERFSLDYVLEAVGSRGVEAIELYGSVDEGATWTLWGRDPDQQSPFDVETREQGVFAYRIVVVGRSGLASPRPQSGDLPDLVVVVDTEAPQVSIRGARYGEGDRIGSLVIRYDCSDTNLMQRPIALSFSENLDGPWTTIASGLRNDGDYVWPADPQLPRTFYLRIDAKDQAGNVGTYILDQAIDAQGLAPRAKIRGFQTLSGS